MAAIEDMFFSRIISQGGVVAPPCNTALLIRSKAMSQSILQKPRRCFDNLPGKVFSRLTVLHRDPKRAGNFLCRCSCGVVKSIDGTAIADSVTRSCGCLFKDTHTTHARSRSKEYRSWRGMMGRCYNKKIRSYHLYGGRGVIVDERWHTFENFFADMGEAPSPTHSVDRFPDNSGNYQPGNCRWATAKQQALNRRNNRLLTFHGETLPATAWAERLGIPESRVHGRIRHGWSAERIFTEPPQKKRRQLP